MSRRPTRPLASGSRQPDGHRECRPAALSPPQLRGSVRRYPPIRHPPAVTPRNAPSPHRAKLWSSARRPPARARLRRRLFPFKEAVRESQ
eukprot:3202009-Pleurochrysis_carterae.AAC.1